MDIFANNKLIFRNIDTIIWDKDATLIDANYFWAEITRRRAHKVLEYYSIDNKHYSEICKNMGLDTQTGKLIELSPVAVLSREEVLNFLHEKLVSLGVKSDKQKNDELFCEVHRDFQECACDYIHLLPYVEELVCAFSVTGAKQFIITSDTKENAILSIK